MPTPRPRWPLVVLFLIGLVLTLTAGAMVIIVRGNEDLMHRTAGAHPWHVNAYSCGLVAGLAALVWVAFVAAAWVRIAAIKRGRGVQ